MTKKRKSTRGPCPTPERRRFRAEIDAQIALTRQPATYLDAQSQVRRRRVYRCACNGWHITDKE